MRRKGRDVEILGIGDKGRLITKAKVTPGCYELGGAEYPSDILRGIPLMVQHLQIADGSAAGLAFEAAQSAPLRLVVSAGRHWRHARPRGSKPLLPLARPRRCQTHFQKLVIASIDQTLGCPEFLRHPVLRSNHMYNTSEAVIGLL